MMCTHERVTFLGICSLVGHYRCDDCVEEIDPVKYAKLKGEHHLDELNPICSPRRAEWIVMYEKV
jgi:hypothetical protein